MEQKDEGGNAMNVETVGKRIAEQRKKLGLTQEALAEQLNVSAQAVSKWENGRNLPDIENLIALSEVLKIPYASLVGEEKREVSMNIRGRLFHENNMYTRVKTLAQAECLSDTLVALAFMRQKHEGQFRKVSRFTTENVAYVNHPLMMACHAHAMGIRDDVILAAILLHDVIEDTDTALEDLPVSDETKAVVDLITFKELPGRTKEESKAVYYDNILQNKKACIVKIIDRCNNISTMSRCFDRDKMIRYIDETEQYVMPIIKTIKDNYPEYCDVAFLVKYQIISLIETIKPLLL